MPLSQAIQGLTSLGTIPNSSFPSLDDMSQPSLTSIPGVTNTFPGREDAQGFGAPASPTPPDTDMALSVYQRLQEQRDRDKMRIELNNPGPDEYAHQGRVADLEKLLGMDKFEGDAANARLQPDPSQQANAAAIAQGYKAPQPMQMPGMGNNVFGTQGPPPPPSPPGVTPPPTAPLPFGSSNPNLMSPSQQANINPRMVAARAASSTQNLQEAQAAERMGQSAREYELGQQASRDAIQKGKMFQILETARQNQAKLQTPTGKTASDDANELRALQLEQANLQNPNKWTTRDIVGGHLGYLDRAGRLNEIQNRLNQMPNMPGHTVTSPTDDALSQIRELFGVPGQSAPPSRVPPGIQSVAPGMARPDPIVPGREWARHPDGRLFMTDAGKPPQLIPE